MKRSSVVKVTEALENLLCETGNCETKDDVLVYRAGKAMWVVLQKVLRWNKSRFEDE